MKAVRLHAFGAPDNLVMDDVPEPQAGPDEVVVRIQAIPLSDAEGPQLADEVLAAVEAGR